MDSLEQMEALAIEAEVELAASPARTRKHKQEKKSHKKKHRLSRFKGKGKTNGTIRAVNGSGGAASQSGSGGARGTSTERTKNVSKFSAFGRLFKPWKWKRKKKSEKFEATSKTLERKISMRVNKEELVQKGILLPDSPTSPIAEGPEGGVQVLPTEIPSGLHPVHQRDTYTFHGGKTASEGGRIHTYSHPNLPNKQHVGYLPEPPIPVSEIGPIPPPPMFSSPSPMANSRNMPPPPYHPPGSVMTSTIQTSSGKSITIANYDDDESEVEEELSDDDDNGGFYGSPHVDTSRVEEVPAREPKLDAKPLKSALKKKNKSNGSVSTPPSGTPTQEGKPIVQDRNKRLPLRPSVRIRFSTKPIKFLTGDKSNGENKENSVPFTYLPPNTVLPGSLQDRMDDSDSEDGPTLYRDDDEEGDGSRLATKIARKDSLAQKLALRPNRQDLIDRNIIPQQSDNERKEFREQIGQKLTRRLSLRPSAEELEERNILRKTTNEEARREKEEKCKTLLRKLSFRPTVEELKERKIIRFNDYIEVTEAHVYDRRADKPWTRLTPRDKAAIRKELNDFKSSEMEVHEDSRHLTRFHRP